MASPWRQIKRALGLNLCVNVPGTVDDYDDDDVDDDKIKGGLGKDEAANGWRGSGAAFRLTSSPAGSAGTADFTMLMPTTPTPSSGGLRLFRSRSESSKRTCTICLGAIKVGHGHAIFTAECCHTFHFHCIASSVRHGNSVCPVCKAKWKEIPFQATLGPKDCPERERANTYNWSLEQGPMAVVRRLPRAGTTSRQDNLVSFFHAPEPSIFNDDEPVNLQSETADSSLQGCSNTAEIKIYPEFLAIQQSDSLKNFTVLIHLKAPHTGRRQCPNRNLNVDSAVPQSSRAPIDLVTLLDVSGSMAGTKLALLKRAMGFVIQNLGPLDRLSVIAFSSNARRLFHLRRMTDSGKQLALQAVNSLVSCGGTNIAQGLRKGARVIQDRKVQNPICSIILLSDGQDTHTLTSNLSRTCQPYPGYRSLVPSFIIGGTTRNIPVHAFGFGEDHDPTSLHSISEISGGTFSFIESEVVIQDAFAQCLGGLLSVVLKEMQVVVECVHPAVQLVQIKSGIYVNKLADDARSGSITVGELYADEERDFLIYVNVPPGSQDIVLLKVHCAYRDAISKETVTLEDEVRIQRPEVVTAYALSMQVDRERNRVHAAEAMLGARDAAERGALSEAVSILAAQRRKLSESVAGKSGDQLCLALNAELLEMQERMANQQLYKVSGRAYLLSGLSSHSSQRATARGDSTNSSGVVHAYQTPSMVDMLYRSRTFSLSPRTPNLPTRHARSSSTGSRPR